MENTKKFIHMKHLPYKANAISNVCFNLRNFLFYFIGSIFLTVLRYSPQKMHSLVSFEFIFCIILAKQISRVFRHVIICSWIRHCPFCDNYIQCQDEYKMSFYMPSSSVYNAEFCDSPDDIYCLYRINVYFRRTVLLINVAFGFIRFLVLFSVCKMELVDLAQHFRTVHLNNEWRQIFKK